MAKKHPVDGRFPFVHHVLVCTGPRCTDERFGSHGGDDIREMLKDHNRQLGRKPLVRVCGVSCMDMCDLAPNMTVWPEGRVWTRVDRSSALEAYEEATSGLSDPVRSDE